MQVDSRIVKPEAFARIVEWVQMFVSGGPEYFAFLRDPGKLANID